MALQLDVCFKAIILVDMLWLDLAALVKMAVYVYVKNEASLGKEEHVYCVLLGIH